ncbi:MULTISPECIES: hypothetical protein [Kordiimonas]|uniref:Uncharacterized protein n=1 Tax=Kordiimonas lacus TaxID=637679 RepID=A0A1G6ZYA8_9PROT|nr:MULTISPECIES: hypothetical protein [Kordiimonas]SDE07227.1 hypothetical protein SAMN04488071_1997 [Kordiimonas lacus]
MTEQATIIDFLGASLRGLEASGRAILSPNEQKLADEIADALDRELEDMVSQLESVASCQQEEDLEDDTPEEELPPFAAFCAGLRRIGTTLLPHLVREFVRLCEDRDVPTGPFRWIIQARADAFVAYLLQLAQVHGLAFDDSLTKVGRTEQIALANLGADLRVAMQRELEDLD